MKSIYTLILIIICSSIIYADDAPVIPAQSGTVTPIYNNDIRLLEETIDIYLYRNKYEVAVNYTFVNTGKAQNVTMGFPNKTRAAYSTPILDFKAYEGKYEDEKALKIFQKNADKKSGTSDEVETYDNDSFECFQTTFKKSEIKLIRNTYSQEYVIDYNNSFMLVRYILKTGAFWKGNIQSIAVTVHLNEFSEYELKERTAYFEEEDEQMTYELKVKPSSYRLVDNKIIMTYKNIEPDFNIEVFLPPNLYLFVGASSSLKGESHNYQAKNIIDNNLSTAWVEGKPDDGIGESIVIVMTPTIAGGKILGAYMIKGIAFINGYCENKRLFSLNNRVKKMKLTYTDYKVKRSMIINLEDNMSLQYFAFDEPRLISELTLTILEVYKGTKYSDTAISEIKIYPADQDYFEK